MPPNRFESEVGNFLEGSHGDRTHIKRAGHHTVTPLCGTLLWSRAGRQISRTGCTNMVRLKPTTPLLALNKGPLKPAAPLRPKTAAKTPISHPQRRWQFQSHTDTSEQRRWQFQSHTDTSEQRRSQFQSHTDTSKQRRSRFQPTGPPHLQHPHGARGRARLRRP